MMATYTVVHPPPQSLVRRPHIYSSAPPSAEPGEKTTHIQQCTPLRRAW
ncbi:unnamed protein product [Staurois parvus]|uniref:Uncharacterized protein n=1 Tax=Staurois parvus TaxID=386267 RepID=A0ABN9DRS7_9NEOB|nr:unnamed protein product [Staurois parvus]